MSRKSDWMRPRDRRPPHDHGDDSDDEDGSADRVVKVLQKIDATKGTSTCTVQQIDGKAPANDEDGDTNFAVAAGLGIDLQWQGELHDHEREDARPAVVVSGRYVRGGVRAT